MHRIVLAFYLFVHVLPFAAVSALYQPGQTLILWPLLLAFPVGAVSVWLILGEQRRPVAIAAPLAIAWPLAIVGVLYLISRAELVGEVLGAIQAGRYFEFALELARERYDGFGPPRGHSNVGTVFFLLYAFLLGARIAGRFAGNALWLLIFVAMIFIESSSLARAGVVLALVALAVEFVIRRNVELANLSPVRLALGGAVPVLAVLGVYVFSAYFRVSGHDYAWQIVIDKSSIYFAAPYAAFIQWFSAGGSDSLDFGRTTFAFLFKLAGVEYRQGAVEPVMTALGFGNIYSIYRGLVQDFGLFGAVAVLWASGALVMFSAFRRSSLVSYFLLRVVLILVFFVPYSAFYFSTFAAAVVLSHLMLTLDLGRKRDSSASAVETR